MVEIKELIIKTTIEPRNNNSSSNPPTRINHSQIKKEILQESVEHLSKVLKNKKEVSVLIKQTPPLSLIYQIFTQ